MTITTPPTNAALSRRSRSQKSWDGRLARDNDGLERDGAARRHLEFRRVRHPRRKAYYRAAFCCGNTCERWIARR